MVDEIKIENSPSQAIKTIMQYTLKRNDESNRNYIIRQ